MTKAPLVAPPLAVQAPASTTARSTPARAPGPTQEHEREIDRWSGAALSPLPPTLDPDQPRDRTGLMGWFSRPSPVQRKRADEAPASSRPPLPAPGGGQPMPGNVQAKMERAFGADFSAVQVHEGPQAMQVGAAPNAAAPTESIVTKTDTTEKKSSSTQATSNAEGPLSPEQITSARAFYTRKKIRYPAELVQEIQTKVGISRSGVLDAATIQAIAQYQHSQGLLVDGQAGATTLTKMFGGDVRMRPDAGPSELVGHDGLSGIHQESIKLTAAIRDAWVVIQPHMPKGAVLTSGLRSWSDSARILTDYFKKKAPQIIAKGYLTQTQVDRIIADKDYQLQHDWLYETKGGLVEYQVAMPGRSRHCSGKALDISGAPLSDIEAALRKADKDDAKVASVFSDLLSEKANNCIHVNLK